MRVFLGQGGYRDKERLLRRMMRVLIETKYDSGSVEVQGSQVRVL